jgi:hypothetical protein
MNWMQRLLFRVLPRSRAEAIEAESRSWVMRCPCGHETSVWEAGGIRYKASGNPRKLLRCAGCGERTWHQIEKRE